MWRRGRAPVSEQARLEGRVRAGRVAKSTHRVGDTCSAMRGKRSRVADMMRRGADATARASSGCSRTMRITFDPSTRNEPCSSLVASARFVDERPIDGAGVPVDSGWEEEGFERATCSYLWITCMRASCWA